MTTKQLWLAGITAAAVSPILPGAVIGYFVIATFRWIDFAIKNDQEEDRLKLAEEQAIS